MRVVVAKRAGFCMGVRRAVDMVLDAPGKYPEPIHTFGPIIHNPQILALLREKGITELDHIPRQGSGTVLIRAHGVPPSTYDDLSRAGFHIIDATCPRVARVQQIIQRNVARDAAAIILGDPDHPEVIGLRGFAGERGFVVSSLQELARLPHLDSAVVVQQTTQSTALYQACREWLAENRPHYTVYSTLCDSTKLRQKEVRELAPQLDAMIVVGGHESGNTGRLAEISRQCGLLTYHIETERELPDPLPDQVKAVGVTAGASTPNWIIKNVHRKLERLPSPRRYLLGETSLRLQRFLLLTNLWVALGAAGLCIGCAALLNASSGLLPALITFFYVHSMHTLNHLTGDRTSKYTDPDRSEFYASHRDLLLYGAVASGIGAVVASALQSVVALALIAVMSFLGLLYNFQVLPSRATFGRFFKIRDIPGSKTVVITLAWTIVAVFMPILTPERNIGGWVALPFLLAAGLIFVRTAFFDILDMEGDRILGRETLPLLFGKRRTLQILKSILVAWAAGLITATILLPSILVAAITICPVSLFLVLVGYEKRWILSQIWLEFLVEAHFLYIGLAAFAVS